MLGHGGQLGHLEVALDLRQVTEVAQAERDEELARGLEEVRPTRGVLAARDADEAPLEQVVEHALGVHATNRKDAPGRPYLFETTREFLVAFGLRDLGDLPKVEGELQVPKLAAVAEHGEAEAQQDPGAGGARVPAES